MAEIARLKMLFLGAPRIELDNQQVHLQTRKACALLAYLALTKQEQSRDMLLNLLWPDHDGDKARAALRHTLYCLKKELGDGWLLINRSAVAMKLDERSWMDVDELVKAPSIYQFHGHESNETCEECRGTLERVVNLYRDDFLCGFSLKDSYNFDDWQLYNSESLRQELGNILEKLAGYDAERRQFDSALSNARKWLALDRLNESAHRKLMQIYALADNRSAAIKQYDKCLRVLQDELGVSPQDATQVLFHDIREGRAPQPSPDSAIVLNNRPHEGSDISEDPDEMDPENRYVTVLTVGLGRNTPMRNDAFFADQLAKTTEGVLHKYDATLDHIHGEQVVIVFGRRQVHESDAEMATYAAFEILGIAIQYGLKVRIGLSTGWIYFNTVSTSEYPNSTMVGSAANLSSRL